MLRETTDKILLTHSYEALQIIKNQYLQKVIHDYGPISNVGLNNVHECSTVHSQQLSQPLRSNREQLRPITKHTNLTTNLTRFGLTNNLQVFL